MHTWPELVALYRLTEPYIAPTAPRYNIAPTQMAPVVRLDDETGCRELVLMRWGLIPCWAKDSGIGARMINARAETVAERPSFRAAFRHRRCLIPTSGFYEWQATPGAAKQPYFIGDATGAALTFAGLWERWQGSGGSTIDSFTIDSFTIDSFTIITTAAAADLASIHDRMPALLDADAFARWLDPTLPLDAARSLLRPSTAALMARPVSRRVNDVRRDNPECLKAEMV